MNSQAPHASNQPLRGKFVRHGCLVGLALLTLCGLPVPSRAAPPIAEWQRQIRANFFIPAHLPALSPETHRRAQLAPGVRVEAVTYSTQFGMRVPAILYLPDPLPKNGSVKIPALVVVNGHGGDKYSWYAYYTGMLYARAGAAVLTYDPVGEGERNSARKSGTRAHDDIRGLPNAHSRQNPDIIVVNEDERLARRLEGLMMTDVMQAVSYLAQRPEVDANRIGAVGYSLGSFVLAMTGAVEPRLRACVLVGGGNLDGPEGIWDNSKPMCTALPYRSLSFLGDRGAVIYTLQAARGPTLIVNGSADTVVGIARAGKPLFDDLQTRVANLRGSRDGVFESEIVPGASHRPFFVTRQVALWLEKELDLPNWTDADIRSLPETRIGDWAKKQNVPIDKLYATEEREAGIRALLDDVPGFRREDLSVFSKKEWEARMDQMVMENWLSKVKHEAQSHSEPSVAPRSLPRR